MRAFARRYGWVALLLLAVVVSRAWGTGSLAVPNTFQTQAGNVPVAQLDTNFTTFRDYINTREITQSTLGARPAAGTAGRWYFATDTGGGTLYADTGSAWVQVAPASWSIVNSQGTARLTLNSTVQLQLGLGQIPLLVGSQWTMRQITASITISNAGLGPSTTYYVYASGTAAATTLVITQAAHSAETSFGVETITGNTNNTLVGMVRTDGSSLFADSRSQRFVASWFARTARAASGVFTNNRATTSMTFVELNTEIRNEFLVWADESVVFGLGGSVAPALPDAATTGIGIDGSTPEGPTVYKDRSATSGVFSVFGLSYARQGLAEGYHFVTLVGLSEAGGSATWASEGTAGRKTVLSTFIR